MTMVNTRATCAICIRDAVEHNSLLPIILVFARRIFFAQIYIAEGTNQELLREIFREADCDSLAQRRNTLPSNSLPTLSS